MLEKGSLEGLVTASPMQASAALLSYVHRGMMVRKLSSEKLCLRGQSAPLPETAAPWTNGDPNIQVSGTGLGVGGVRKSPENSEEAEFGSR